MWTDTFRTSSLREAESAGSAASPSARICPSSSRYFNAIQRAGPDAARKARERIRASIAAMAASRSLP